MTYNSKAIIWFYLLLLISLNSFADGIQFGSPIQLATDMLFTEGPAWYPDGYLVFSDIDGNVIYKWSEANGLETFASPSGNSSGIVCTKNNDFVLCRQGTRDIARMSSSGVIAPLLSQYKGKKFNSPNDLELSYLGSVYFTDPDYVVNAADRELKYEGLFCIPYNKTEAVLLDSTLARPKGLTFASDWRTLYVCESSTNTIYSYNLRNEYQIQDITKDKKVFLKVTGNEEIDGITSDILGNIYVAFGDGGIKIFDKDANAVGQITFPITEKVRNLCFGGKYSNILFVTAGKSLYKVDIRLYGDFVASGLLGVPTNKSVVFNALSDKTLEAYIAYGTSDGNFTNQTSTQEYPANIPMEIIIDGLSWDTQYYYQLFYRVKGETTFKSATMGQFHTQRATGEQFSFAVEADPHLDEGSNYTTFRNTLQNALNLKPDFLIDLGDNFLTEKFPIPDNYYIEQRNLIYRNFWDKVCSSMPLFIVLGNHEGELGWLNYNQPDDVFNLATSIRKIYYPTPEPSDFYSGNETIYPFVGKRENYYAWNWGDALFVVIDPYCNTMAKTSDPWGFTLGKTQYDWFRKTLEESNAKFKFVFAHQLVGGDNLGRGGAEIADYFENGGKNADGTYGFDAKRPGWGKPLHQIMVENGVQIYFHGHDHFYAEQPKDGIIYQEVPQPSFPAYTVANNAQTWGYVSGTIIPSSGHLNVKILGDSAQVDYIGGYHVNNPSPGLTNGVSRRTYYVKAKSINTGVDLPVKKSNSIEAYQSGGYLFLKSFQNIQVQITIYSATGQCMGILHQGVMPSGTSVYKIPDNISSGLYLVNIKSTDFMKTIKIILV
ncbi:MAG: SMP-30/gluconolactonase/LRE family protein [Bacteroidales bacterium]|nr:SMP-30/gluconolactonase/LRE family protein [Bacteroidales bacterium]